MLIHKMRLDDNMAVLDVNSGAVHLVDEVIYDLLDYYNGSNGAEAIAALKDKYSEEDLQEALSEMQSLQEEGLLFSPSFDVPPTFAEKPIVKSLCLLVTHDCNLRCGYCFADTGSFGGCRQLMSKETAEKAVEFAIEGSKKRHNLELDLFGGEPLMNWPVVTHIVNYVSDIDRISITHEAFSREGFALGAVVAAEWLKGKNGFFSMDDVMGAILAGE